ncbi:MAG TPA: hypothetical protein PLV70_10030 [Flavobacteriales bacterium]|nr:hypothetical protein [Flavobacteriales bacterium]HRO39740.1 hypothetical protein [Flavobacteriales bacterium]HRP80533.1 hypothetical protein [Flavobacteriales bacterium]HRQ85438.1 hypothetical protein [Flavobacteriales bacterium]
MGSKQILAALMFSFAALAARAQNTIYGYAIGNWRNGPVVEISPLFETTEMYTTPHLIAWVRQQWPASFTDTTDIDVQRFATVEEGAGSRTSLKAKYGLRRLQVHEWSADEMPRTPAVPGKSAMGAPR